MKAPSQKQIKAAKLFLESLGTNDPKSMREILKEAGYSQNMADNPQMVTQTKTWASLMDEYIGDDLVAQAHQSLLMSRKLDHMVFPLEKVEDNIPEEGDIPEDVEAKMKSKRITDNLTDEDIIEMLEEVNCKVRRIVHGDQARHVYFWSPDNTAKAKAIELAYKARGRLISKVEVKNTDKRKEILEGYGLLDVGQDQETAGGSS